MNPEQTELLKELELLNWGTTMPLMLMVGGEIRSVRGWGKAAIAVLDPARFESAAEEPDDLRSQVKGFIAMRLGEALAEAGAGPASLEDILAARAALEETLRNRLEPDFTPLGLAASRVTIEALNQVQGM